MDYSEEITDLLIECDQERSKVKWLAAALNAPEIEIRASLEQLHSKGEVRQTGDGYWQLVT